MAHFFAGGLPRASRWTSPKGSFAEPQTGS